MAREADADMVWATLFLRRFGSDFWGEHVGPHPYHEVEAPRRNEWLDMPAVAVFETFVQSVKASPSSDGNDDETATRRALLAFVQEQGHGDSSGRQGGGWKRAYKRMEEMVRTWRTFCLLGFLVAGETSFARLSAIVDVIKAGIFANKMRYMAPSNDDPPLPPVIENVDVTSPAGNARVLRINIPAANRWERPCWTNFCAVRRPRNWWNREQLTEKPTGNEGEEEEEEEEVTVAVHFRGLQIGNWLKWNSKRFTRLHVIYAVDCERMADPDYQEQVFRELHGFLGEGKGQFEDGLFVNLHLINAPPEFGPERILERLKIPLCVSPSHHCPYYAGPVVFFVTSFTMPPADAASADDEPVSEREKRETLIMQGVFWLSKQPMADRPHAYVRSNDSLWLCALTDARADEQRRAQADW